MSSSYRMELDKWLTELEVKADRVLDIGGLQNPIKGRTKSWDVKEYLIADLPEPHKSNPKPYIILDLNLPYTTEFKQNCRTFNIIFCLEVFEYIYDPKKAFEYIAMLLDLGGTAWVSFPSVYPLHQPVEDDALRYMPAGIVKLAESVGLSVEQMIKRRPESNLLEAFYSTERMRMAKNHDHHFTGFICEFKK